MALEDRDRLLGIGIWIGGTGLFPLNGKPFSSADSPTLCGTTGSLKVRRKLELTLEAFEADRKAKVMEAHWQRIAEEAMKLAKETHASASSAQGAPPPAPPGSGAAPLSLLPPSPRAGGMPTR